MSTCKHLYGIIVLKSSFGAKPPNLMTANISGYMVFTLSHIRNLLHIKVICNCNTQNLISLAIGYVGGGDSSETKIKSYSILNNCVFHTLYKFHA